MAPVLGWPPLDQLLHSFPPTSGEGSVRARLAPHIVLPSPACLLLALMAPPSAPLYRSPSPDCLPSPHCLPHVNPFYACGGFL